MKKANKDAETSVRHGKLKASSAIKNVLKTALTSLLVIAFSGIAVAAYAIWDLADSVETVHLASDPEKDFDLNFSGKPIDGAFAIALIGSDTREGQEGYNDGVEGELNDVNIVLYVDESHKNATVLSLSRDLMLPVPACPDEHGNYYTYPESEAQLNSALYKGGLVCVVRALEEYLDLDIPYAGLITFDGVINMSNAIGGVEVCLTEPIVDPDTDLDLPAGDVTLVGIDALQFLRTRGGVGDGGDGSRISNQQLFMASMVRQLQEAATFSDPGKVYRLAKAAVENITLSDTLVSIPVMQSMAMVLKDLELERINFVQFPVTRHPYDTNRLTADWYAAEELLAIMKSGEPFELDSLGKAVIELDENGEPLVPENMLQEPDYAEPEYQEPEIMYEEPQNAEGEEDIPNVEEDTGPVKINPSITGQSAAQATCSQGRTAW